MSKQVDERIVSMQFDNKQFEQNVNTTMSTLEKLKQSLKFKDASKGFENLDKASKKVDFTQVEKTATRAGFHIQDVWLKLSEVFEYQIARRIVNSATNIAKALTIDPVKTGFQEYETQINAVQTILANTESKGSTLDDVNRALEELNKYADQTIYNFTEMTRNIGTFTAAGVELDTATNAIKGIANLAAVSGSTSQQASTAMYQLSQAMASGTVKLMDWNSVVNAGMGGQVFQDALKETARVHGVAIDQMIKDEGSFRETLKDGWLTTEILTETLQKFTLTTEGLTEAEIEQNRQMLKAKGYTDEQIESIFKLGRTATDAATKVKTFSQMWDVIKESAQSGWAQTWKLIIGDFEEAKSLFTPLTNFFTGFIQKMSDFRNTILKTALSSPLGTLYEKFSKISSTLKNMTSASTDAANKMAALGDIVDRVIRGDFGNMEPRWNALTKLGYDWAKVQNLVNERLGSSVRYTEATTDAQKAQVEQLGELTDAKLLELGLTEEEIKAYRELEAEAAKSGLTIEELLGNMDQLDGRTMLINSLKNAGQGLVGVFRAIGDAWKSIFPEMTTDNIAAGLYNLISRFHEFSKKLGPTEENAEKFRATMDKLKRTFRGLFAIIDIVTTITGGAFKLALKVLCKLFGAVNVDILSVTASVGDAIVAFRDWLDNNVFVNAIEKIATVIGILARETKELVDAFMSLPQVQNVISQVKSSLMGMYEVGKNAVLGLINGLRDGTISISNTVLELGRTILDTIKTVLGIHSPSTEFFEIGRNIIQGLLKGLQNGVSSVWNFIKNIGTTCIDIIKKIDFGAIISVGITTGLTYSILKIAGAITSLVGILEGLGDVFEGLGTMFKGIGKYFKAKAWNLIGKAVLNMAIAIGILAASVYVLASLDAAKLWGAVGAIAALVAIMSILVVVANNASKIKGIGSIKFGALAGGLLGISASLLLLAMAIKKLSFLNSSNIGPVLIGLTAMITGLTLILAAFGKFVKGKAAQNIDKAGVTLLKMSFVLLSLTLVIKQISKLEPTALFKGGAAILAFVGIVALLTMITNTAGKNVDKMGVAILKISTAMILLIAAIKLVSGLEPEELVKGGAVILAFVGIVALMTKAVTSTGKDVAKVGGVILGISAAMMLMVITMRMVAGLDAGALAKGIVCITSLGLLIAGLIKVVKIAAGESIAKVSFTILSLSIAIGILATLAIVLGLIKLENLAKGVIAIGILGGMISLMIDATKNAQQCEKTIMMMSVAIGVMAASIAVLSFINPAKLAGATIALSVVMGMFALMTKAAGSAKASIGSLIIMTVSVGLMAGLIYLLSTLKTESALSNALALSALMLSLSAALAVVGSIGKLNTGAVVKGIIGLTAMMVPLMALIAIINFMPADVSKNIQTMQGVMQVMTVLSILLAITAGVGAIYAATGGVAMLGIVGLLAMMVPLMALIAIINYLPKDVSKNINTMRSVVDLMAVMTELLIPLAIIGPLALIGVGALGALTILMAGIGAFAIEVGALVTLFPQLEEFLNKGIPILEKLANGLGSIIGNFINGLATGALSGLPEMGKQLSEFTKNAAIDPTVVEGVKSLSEALLIITGANLLDIGDNNLSKFGEQLSSFGPKLAAFGDSIQNITVDKMKVAAESTKLLAEALSEIPTDWGHNNLTKFGEQLIAFGPDLGTFGENVANVKPDTIKAAAESTKLLAEAFSEIPFDWNHNEMIKFGDQLVSFGPKLETFGGSVANINSDSITTASKAIKALAEALSDIPFDWSHNNLIKFGEQLVAFGPNLVEFHNQLSGISPETIKSVGAAVSNFISTVSNALLDNKQSMFDSWKETGKYVVDGFAEGIDTNTFKAEAKAKAMAKAALRAANKELDVNSPSKKFIKTGASVVEGLSKGIVDNVGDAEKASVTMSKGILTATQDYLKINSPSLLFKEEVGRYIVQGIADGIKDETEAEKKAREKAEKIARVMIDTFDKVLSNNKSDISAIDNDLEYWNLTEGRNVSEEIKASTEKASLYNRLAIEQKNETLAMSKYYDLFAHKAELGADGEQKIKDAYLEWQDARNQRAATEGEIADLTDYSARMDRSATPYDSKIGAIESKISWRNSLGSDEVTEAQRDADNLTNLKEIALLTSEKRADVEKIYIESLTDMTLSSEQREVLEKTYFEQLQREGNAWNEVRAYSESMFNKEIQAIEDEISRKDTALDLWEATYGEKASDEARDAKYLKYYNDVWAERTELALKAQQAYLDAVETYGKNSDEAESKWDAWQRALVDEAKAKNAVTDYIKSAQERENNQLQEVYDLTQSNADIQYQIWEKTLGRDATNAEKEAKKLSFLSQQVTAQTSSVALATKKYNEAVAEYGRGSNEALAAYNNYLNEQLELANLQSDILDIEEKNAKRQKKARNAKSDYEEYMKKYEKYYLDHGMTLEELEKDARLVSGYDPTAKVESTVSKISSSLTTLGTAFSTAGTTYTANLTQGIQNGTPSVIESTTTMLTSCITQLTESQPQWVNIGSQLLTGFITGMESKTEEVKTKAVAISDTSTIELKKQFPYWFVSGVHLVDGFVKGIESHIQAAAMAAAAMARTALNAANDVLGIASPSKEFRKSGVYSVQGYTEGLKDRSALGTLKDTISKVFQFIEEGVDTQPTIRPVMDLSDVEAGATKIGAMFSRSQAVSIRDNMGRRNSETIQNGVGGSNGETKFEFTQNNYSPKALSRTEIYRQTRNQFSTFKRLVKA